MWAQQKQVMDAETAKGAKESLSAISRNLVRSQKRDNFRTMPWSIIKNPYNRNSLVSTTLES